MSKPNIKQDLLISFGIALLFLGLLFLAKQYPVQSYTSRGLCGVVEKYTILYGETDDYSRLVEFYQDNRGNVDIEDKGIADSVKACPQGGKISLYVL